LNLAGSKISSAETDDIVLDKERPLVRFEK